MVEGAGPRMTKPYPIDPASIPDQELVRTLLDRYAPTPIPPCKICGGMLYPQGSAGPKGIVYYCPVIEEPPGEMGRVRQKEGRGEREEFLPGGHYYESAFLDPKGGVSDPLVAELCNRFNALPKPGRGGWSR